MVYDNLKFYLRKNNGDAKGKGDNIVSSPLRSENDLI
jgi:hypothetical protein